MKPREAIRALAGCGMARLIDDGCRFFQGYLFGRPMASTVDPSELVDARIAS